MANAKAIPDGTTSITPYLVLKDAAQAIDFYKRAFGATEILRMPGPDGSIAHAEIQIGNARVYMTDENAQMGASSPQTLGGTPVMLMHYVERVDEVFARATEAGAKPLKTPTDMFWGDRWSLLEDPYGHQWQIATHVEDLTPGEMMERMKTAAPAQA
jgi:PhnB protein